VEDAIRFGPTQVKQPKFLQLVSIPVVVLTVVAAVFAVIDAAELWNVYVGVMDRSEIPLLEWVRLYGNFAHAATGIFIVAIWAVLTKRLHAINYFIAFIGGSVGGIVRVYVIREDWADHDTKARMLSVLASGIWLVIAAAVASLVSQAAMTIVRDRNSLVDALRGEQTSRELMLTAETQLRREISERLHGPLQAELIVAVRELRHMGGAGDSLADRLDHVREHEVRRLSHALHPSLVDIDLATALVELRDLHARHGQIDLDLGGLESDPFSPTRITGRLALAIHRIVEEGINNAFRHGGATHVDVAVSASPSEVELTVSDNGSGPPEDAAPGVGMRIIHTWVRAFDGRWDLISHPDRGAVLHAVFPVRPDQLTTEPLDRSTQTV
jgi:signal transduction histidine kinase